MAITGITIVQREQVGFSNVTVNTLNLDASYPTGGYALSSSALGIGANPDWVAAAPKSGFIFEYDYANQKLLARWSAAAGAAFTEVTNGTNLSTVTGVRVMAMGS